MPKLKNSHETFWVIFNQCESLSFLNKNDRSGNTDDLKGKKGK